MQKNPQLWFHDALITEFQMNNGSIILKILYAVDSHENNYKVDIIFNNVHKIETDADINNSNLMDALHGEVLTLNIKNQRCELIALWRNFNDKNLNSHIKYYYIDYASIDIQTEEIPEPSEGLK